MSIKDEIRNRIWRILEEKNIADFPRPVYGRIPNFKGSDLTCERIRELEEYKRARVVKVNPDSPQRRIRELCLRDGKILIMPTPRIRNGFLLLDPRKIPPHAYREASTISGAYRWGIPVKPWDLPKIDLVIVGSVAVDKRGIRLGKGEGYAELEWGILAECGKVDQNTPIITNVHDVQVIDEEIPYDVYDLPVDIIVTPTRIIRTCPVKEKPRGIYWNLLPEKKLSEIPILQELKKLKLAAQRREP